MRLIEAKARLEHLLSELTSSDAQTVFSLKESQFIPDALEIAVYAMRYLIDQGYKIKLVEEKRGEEMNAPICPHCGQPDEENVWLAKQQDEEYDDIFDCENCGGAYRLRNRGGVYEVEAVKD